MFKGLWFGLSVALLQIIACYAGLDDYCDLGNCNGRTHITCNMPDGAFGADCPDDVHMLNLRDRAQDLIVDTHNSLRNALAGGNISNYSPAAHMGTIRWNVTFANLARRNVRQCKSKVDSCRSTPDFDFVGQNVGHLTYNVSDDTRSLNDKVVELVNSWFSQNQLANMDVIDAYKANRTAGGYNFFAQIARDYATRIGCACAQFGTNGLSDHKTLLLTCNYDLGLVVNYPIYESTTDVAGSGCTTGTNPNYPNLCSEDERWDVNNFHLI